MDFFRRQIETRRLSRWLVLLFIVAVALIILAVDFVVVTAVAILSDRDGVMLAGETLPYDRFPGTILLTSLVVLSIIGIASLVRISQLSAGGGSVAQALGGTRVTGDTTDPLRRRLLNVVEEMAIASGVPVPEVYVLEREPGINAFAAGDNPANAAVAVTRGALTSLDRAELQGVIAHEFSHILNGDMRLSTRLIGWLFGLLVMAMIARLILRHAPRGGGRRGGGAIVVVMVAAVAILVLGYIGLFFGRLIQAAVARRRESLADTSAIQFTRDPTGLRGALVKIGALEAGSRFREADAEEVAHLLFAPGVVRAFRTHPPLVERIRAIDPGFRTDEFDAMRRRLANQRALAEQEAMARAERAAVPPAGAQVTGAVALAPAAIVRLVANPGTGHVLQAHELLLSLPAELREAGNRPEHAAARFLALALDPAPDARGRQLSFIEQQLSATARGEIEALLPVIDTLRAEQRMPALLQLFPALQQLGRGERLVLLRCLNGLLTREGRVSVFAYALRKLAQVQLRDELQPRTRFAGDLSLNAARDDLRALLSVLALSGSEDEATAERAYAAGMQELQAGDGAGLERIANWPRRLDAALNRLDRLKPAAKAALVRALVRTISHDLRMTVGESELLRAICAALHCPLPSLTVAPAAGPVTAPAASSRPDS